MFKKMILAMVIIMMPIIISANHYTNDTKTIMYNVFNNKIWLSDDISNRNIVVGNKIVKNVKVKNILGQNYTPMVGTSGNQYFDKIDMTIVITITFTDGSRSVKTVINNVPHSGYINESTIFLSQITNHILNIQLYNQNSSGGFEILFRIYGLRVARIQYNDNLLNPNWTLIELDKQ